MGKKVEKALTKDKNHSSTSHDTPDDDPNKTPEPYKCTGHFQNDFTEMCRRINLSVIPPVVLRPKAPLQTVTHDSKPEKGGAKGKQPVPEPEPEPEVTEGGEPIEPPPKTYTTKEKFEYFKPTIQVEMDHPEKWDTVTEIYVKGWKIDMAMMGIFQMSWPMLDKLHTINLWSVGLTGETLQVMATFLPLCANLRNVILDGNNVKEENWSCLIQDDSNIQNLSLRYCSITNKGAFGIGLALGNSKKVANPEASNTKLLSLNLSGNLIEDEGAEYIAKGLRMNRSLLSLSLNANRIGDQGAAKLAEALSRFSLSHEEVVERRRQLSSRSPDRNGRSPPPSRRDRDGSRDRPNSVRSTGTHVDKDKKGATSKPSAKKKDPKGKDVKDETTKGGGGKKEKDDPRGATKGKGGPGTQSQASMTTESGKTVGGKTKGKTQKGKSVNSEIDPDLPEVINPLLEVADLIDSQLWVPGNRILINLNLARNKIGEAGLSALLKAVQYQTTLTALDSRHNGSGLMRLCLDRNLVPKDSPVLKKINDHMVAKDPFTKVPATPEGDN